MTYSLVERTVDLAVLGAVAWPVVGPCTSPQFWRAFPVFTRVLAGLLVVYVAGLAFVAAAAPTWVLRSLVAVGLGVLLATHWHSTANRGRARRWPPGSLRPLQLGPWFGRDFFRDQCRRFGSPFKTSQFARPMACFVGLPGGIDFLRDHEAALGSPSLPFGRFIPGGFLRYMTPDRHMSVKDGFRQAMVREVYDPLAPFVRDRFRAEFARMTRASDESGGLGVPPRRHIQRSVFAVWARLFFDIHAGTDAYARLKKGYQTIDIRNPGRVSDRQVREALSDIAELLRAQLTSARPPGVNAPGSFLEALAGRRPELIDDPAVLSNLIYIAHTTWSDVSGLLQWAFRMLTEHGAWAERLRSGLAVTGADEGDGPGLSTRIVMETLRLEQSEHLYRFATRDIEHDGVVIPRGWLVRLCVRESHRDPSVFDDPEAFNPDRFLSRTYTRREYAPFGVVPRHACLGEGLTKFTGRLFAEELARGFTWRTASDGPYEYSAWRHWRPSSAWRVMVAPVA